MATSVRLPEDAEKRLTLLAKITGRSKAFYIREAILDKLDEMEDVYLAEATLERIRRGEEEVFTLADVRKEFDLES